MGEWLSKVKDWAISRERYWATPLPIWETEDGTERVVIGSVEELKKHTKKSGNTYFVMRHGEAESNINQILSADEKTCPLTETGKQQVKKAIELLKKEDIDVIVASPILRTRETAEMVQGVIQTEKGVLFDNRLKETDFGIFDGKSKNEYESQFPNTVAIFTDAPEKGEDLNDVRARVGNFLYELEERYKNKKILIVSHGDPTWMALTIAQGATPEKALEILKNEYLQTGELRELDFVPLPHNKNYELDLHRPFVDDVVLMSPVGQQDAPRPRCY